MHKLNLEKTNHFLVRYYHFVLGIFFVLLICLGLMVYYQLVYLTMKAKPELTLEKTTIDQEKLEMVLNNLEQRENNLERIRQTSYSNPFQ